MGAGALRKRDVVSGLNGVSTLFRGHDAAGLPFRSTCAHALHR